MKKNLDDFFLNNLVEDLRSEAKQINKNTAAPTNFTSDQKRPMTLAEYKEQMKKQKISPASTLEDPSTKETKKVNAPENYQNFQQPTNFYHPNYSQGIFPLNSSQGFSNNNLMPPIPNYNNNFYYHNDSNNINHTMSIPPSQQNFNYLYPNNNNNHVFSNNPSNFNDFNKYNKTIGLSGYSLSLSSLEETYYQRLYDSIPTHLISGEIPVKDVAELMKTSRLSKEILKDFLRKLNKIDNGPTMTLTKLEFFLVLKMIALTQGNKTVNEMNTSDSSLQTLPIFHNLEEENAFDSFQTGRKSNRAEANHENLMGGNIKNNLESLEKNNKNNKNLIEMNTAEDEENEFTEFEGAIINENKKSSDFSNNEQGKSQGLFATVTVGAGGNSYDKYNVFDEIQNETGEKDQYNPFSPQFTKKSENVSKDNHELCLEKPENEEEFMDFQGGPVANANEEKKDNFIIKTTDDLQKNPADLFGKNYEIFEKTNKTHDVPNKNIDLFGENDDFFGSDANKQTDSKTIGFSNKQTDSKTIGFFQELNENIENKPKNSELFADNNLTDTWNMNNNSNELDNRDINFEENALRERHKERELKKKAIFQEDLMQNQSPMKPAPIKEVQEEIDEFQKFQGPELEEKTQKNTDSNEKKPNIFEIDWPEITETNNANIPNISNTHNFNLEHQEINNNLDNRDIFEVPPGDYNKNHPNIISPEDPPTKIVDSVDQGKNLQIKHQQTEDLMDFEGEEEVVEVLEQKDFKNLLEGGPSNSHTPLKTQDLFVFSQENPPNEQLFTKQSSLITSPAINNNFNSSQIFGSSQEKTQFFAWEQPEEQPKITENDEEFEWNEAPVIEQNENQEVSEKTQDFAAENPAKNIQEIPKTQVNLLELFAQVESLLPGKSLNCVNLESFDEENLEIFRENLEILELFDEKDRIEDHLQKVVQRAALENVKKSLISEEKYEEVIKVRDAIKEIEKKALTNEEIRGLFEVYKAQNGKSFSYQCVEKLFEMKNAEHFLSLFAEILKETANCQDFRQVKAKKQAFVHLAEKIDENIAFYEEILRSLSEEFRTIESIKLKLVSEQEIVQKNIVSDYKFQIYIAGLQKLFEIFKNLKENLSFLDPHTVFFAVKAQDPDEILKKITDLVEISRTFSPKSAFFQGDVANTQVFPYENQRVSCDICLVSLKTHEIQQAKGRQGHLKCLNYWLNRVKI